MNLKTFRAASMAEALALVKRELGKDAVILNTRSTRVGGVLGFFAKTVVEVTASDQGALLAKRAVGQGRGSAGMEPGGGRSLLQTASERATPNQPGAASSRSNPVEQVLGAGKPPFFAAPSGSPTLPAAWPGGDATGSASVAETGGIAGVYAKPSATAPRATASLADGSNSGSPVVMAVRSMGSSGVSGTGEAGRAQAGHSGPSVMAVRPGRIEQELAAIKMMVSQVLQSSPPVGIVGGVLGGAGVGMPESLFEHYLRLLESQMARTIADEIVGKVRDELSPGELADDSIVRASVLRHLSDLLPAQSTPPRSREACATDGDRAGPADSKRRPHVIALVGPTGVGKTTTTAKLAAAFKLRHGRSVALITTDTYRIAAVDQLRTYANIIGLPLKVVMSPEEMTSAIRELSEFDVVLIDTAGRSQHNADRLDELAAFLEAAEPDETHLVLSCAASEQVMLRTAEAFAPARPTRILFSKLDEAVSFGLIVNVVRGVRERLGLVPVSYVTTGQEVPDHIEPGRPDRLARMILDNRMEVCSGDGPGPRPNRRTPEAQAVGA